MRTRVGAYRILPAPKHVVLMRYTGEDGRRDDEDGAIVRIAGEITSPGAVCDVLAMLGQTRWRGELVVMTGDHARSLFLDRGNVVGVETSVEGERLGCILYSYGLLSGEDHQRVLAELQPGERYGDTAVGMGLLSREQIYAAIGHQVEEVFYATMLVSDGTFFFLDGFDDTRLVTRIVTNASSLLMQGVTRMDEMKYFRERIPSAEYVPVRNASSAPIPDECLEVYAAVDGVRTVEQIGRTAGKGEFDTTKQLYALAQSKHVAIRPPRVAGGPQALVELANAGLRRIHSVAAEGGEDDALRFALASFCVGAGLHAIVFRGSGPDQTGALKTDVVAENLQAVVGRADPDEMLKQLLHEYVSFALFSVGGILDKATEQELHAELAPILPKLSSDG